MEDEAAISALGLPMLCFANSFTCIFVIVWAVAMLAGVFGFIFWIFMLIDVIRRDDEDFPSTSKDQKVLWLLIIFLGSYVGAIVYYFMVYKKQGGAK